MKKLLFAVMVLAPICALAQNAPDLNARPLTPKSTYSLFDPSRLTMRQSYSFGYFSGAGGSSSIGLYMNSIEYQVSNPLRIRVDLGFVHNPSALFSGRTSAGNSGAFVPGFAIDWRPSRYFNVRLDYRQVPAFNYGGNGYYYNPYSWEENR